LLRPRASPPSDFGLLVGLKLALKLIGLPDRARRLGKLGLGIRYGERYLVESRQKCRVGDRPLRRIVHGSVCELFDGITQLVFKIKDAGVQRTTNLAPIRFSQHVKKLSIARAAFSDDARGGKCRAKSPGKNTLRKWCRGKTQTVFGLPISMSVARGRKLPLSKWICVAIRSPA